jgi:hypothetical protein
MNDFTIPRWTIGAAAAVMMLSGASAMAQVRPYAPGTDCSKLLSQAQQTDCQLQQENSTMGPGSPGPLLPGGNGSGTNQNGTLNPNGSSGQTNGSSLGGGGGNGGASPPGQTGN